ncbi:unnamed protein product [Porites evermanni]|uniref:Uncharacterized protein n=1 Tax=Porites evermanni TaxID=104178 RepID=A0ABN8N8I7_9CNID|nr:unnamed protein product [Porites evermanni]
MEDEDVEERDTDGESLLWDSSKVQSSAVETKFKRKIAALGYLQCYFFTIAVILGNGTVGLPRVLNESGFTVYVAVVLLQTSIQVLVVFYFVELLQRGYLAKRQLREETVSL